MNSESLLGTAINLPASTEILLESSDQTWLDSYGVNPSWQDSDELIAELNQLITDGSRHLNHTKNQSPEAHACIMFAREKFFSFVGIPSETLKATKEITDTLIPVDTFVKSQRTMSELGLDAAKVVGAVPVALGRAPESIRGKFNVLTELGLDAIKVINTLPAAIGYATESIQVKFDVLTKLGLDAVKVINAMPAAIGYATESIQAKVDNLTELGLDAAKIINTEPVTIGLAPESIRMKFDNLAKLGLDAAKVFNKAPVTLGLAPESIQAKVDNLTELGLDAAKIINAAPTSISFAPESVRGKVRFIQKSADLLRWEYSAIELIEAYPAILGFNIEKLKVLRRIAADKIDTSERNVDPKVLKSALITPLERYIITLSESENTDSIGIKELKRIASRNKESAPERRERAVQLAPSLGKIGLAYSKYKK